MDESTNSLLMLRKTLLEKKELGKMITAEIKLLNRDFVLREKIANRYELNPNDSAQLLLYMLLIDGHDSKCMCGKPKQFYRYCSGLKKTCGDKKCIDASRNESYLKTAKIRFDGKHHTQLQSTKNSAKQTMLKLYGVDHNWKGKLRETGEKTMIQKYGSKHALQNKDLLKKRNETTIARFGSLDFFGSKSAKITNLQRYGFENPAKSTKIIAKIKETNRKTADLQAQKKLEIYKISMVKYLPEQQRYVLHCNKCGNTFEGAGCTINSKLRIGSDPCVFCNPTPKYYGTSDLEKELFNFIKDNAEKQMTLSFHDRSIIPGLELDVYFPSLKVAIEINGIYWHSEMEKEHDYHTKKTKESLNLGIKVYHIWEDDWKNKNEIVKSIILNIMGKSKPVQARKCTCLEINTTDAFEFCEKHHLMGGKKSSIAIGLFHEGNLVGTMTFRKNKGSGYEIDRMCFTCGVRVLGGASKMLKKFVDLYRPSEILTMADANLTPDPNSAVYSKIGLNLIGWTKSYNWVVDGIRQNRHRFMKSKLVKNGADPNLSETQIMHNAGHYRTFECGNWKYGMKFN